MADIPIIGEGEEREKMLHERLYDYAAQARYGGTLGNMRIELNSPLGDDLGFAANLIADTLGALMDKAKITPAMLDATHASNLLAALLEQTWDDDERHRVVRSMFAKVTGLFVSTQLEKTYQAALALLEDEGRGTGHAGKFSLQERYDANVAILDARNEHIKELEGSAEKAWEAAARMVLEQTSCGEPLDEHDLNEVGIEAWIGANNPHADGKD